MSSNESIRAKQTRVEWRGTERTEQSTVADGQVVLDAAESAGVGLPFGCKTRACETCTARLLDGEVVYKRPPRALKQRHCNNDYILSRIARPTTAVCLEVGSDVHKDLVENPWK
jgi:ferredoxin